MCPIFVSSSTWMRHETCSVIGFSFWNLVGTNRLNSWKVLVIPHVSRRPCNFPTILPQLIFWYSNIFFFKREDKDFLVYKEMLLEFNTFCFVRSWKILIFHLNLQRTSLLGVLFFSSERHFTISSGFWSLIDNTATARWTSSTTTTRASDSMVVCFVRRCCPCDELGCCVGCSLRMRYLSIGLLLCLLDVVFL